MVRAMVYVLVLCFWGATLKAESLSPNTVLKRVERFYQAVESFYLEFIQEVYWRRGSEVEASGGKIWFRKPNLLRWEYRYPESLLIVSDGQKVYFYSKEDQQVTIFPLNKAFSKLILSFLSGRASLSEKFELISGKPEGKNFYILELRPREEEQVSRVRLRVLSETGEVKELWSWDILGNLTHIVFENSQFDLKIEAQKFLFVPPKGVEIIEEDGL